MQNTKYMHVSSINGEPSATNMSSIYDVIYGSGSGGDGASAGGGSGSGAGDGDQQQQQQQQQQSAQHQSSSGRKKRSRPSSSHPDGEYAYDPIDGFYDAPPTSASLSLSPSKTTSGRGQSSASSPGADPHSAAPSFLQRHNLGFLSLGQDYSTDDGGGVSGSDGRAGGGLTSYSDTDGSKLHLDSDDENYEEDDDEDGDTSGSGRKSRRRRRRRSSLLTSTPQQLERKRRRMERGKRRRRFRHKKRWDFSKEEDYGGAVKTMMQRLMDEGKKPKKRSGTRKTSGDDDITEKSSEEEEESDDMSEVGEGEGEVGVLGSLRRLQQMSQDTSDQNDNSNKGKKLQPEEDTGPLAYLKKGYSHPVTAPGMADSLEYSYTRDSSRSSSGARGAKFGVRKTQLPLHGKNPAVVRIIDGGTDTMRERGVIEPFYYFPLMSRHGHLGGRPGVEDIRGHLSRVHPSTYLPPRDDATKWIEVEKGKGDFGGNTKRARQVKIKPVPSVPSVNELHLDQLRRVAACLVSRSTGAEFAAAAAAADGATSPPQRRKVLFRLVSLLHSTTIDPERPNNAPYSREKVLLQYAREVESNRELWRKVRGGIKERLQRLQEDDSHETNMRELQDFSEGVIDVMDELLGDEPCWMCGPNETWEQEAMRVRAARVRRRIEQKYPPTKKEDNEERMDDEKKRSAAASTDEQKDDEKENSATGSPRKVRFEMDGDSDYVPSGHDDDDNDDDDDDSPPMPSSSTPTTRLSSAIRKDQTSADGADDDDASGQDKYAAMLRGSSRLDPTILVISVAALVSELCMARAKARSEQDEQAVKSDDGMGYQPLSAMQGQSSAQDQVLELKQDVLFYFDLVLKTFPLFHQYKDIPHPNLAAAAMLRQSFVANDQSAHFNETGREYSIGHDAYSDCGGDAGDRFGGESDMDKEKVDMALVAEDLANTGRKLMTDPRLKVFPELHITTVIASIAAILPPSAAEILSRPCSLDDPAHRTPFDLMRSALEDMESRGQISHSDEGTTFSALAEYDNVKASRLVSELLAAADTAHDCTEENQEDPQYLSWHLALLAGATCISSGIIIGQGAQRAASDYYDDHGDVVRRTRTANHAEIRLLAAKSFRKLLEQCKSTRSQAALHHVAISSFLEWREAACLLMRRGVNDNEHFGQIRKLHAFHTIQWAKIERSDAALLRVDELYSSHEVNADVPLMLLADRVEQEPDDDERWMHLASALGPLGAFTSSQKQQDSSCSLEGCCECPRLQSNIFVDHKALKHRKQHLGWWGDGRADWWEGQFFGSPPLDAKDLTPLFISVHDALVELIQDSGDSGERGQVYNGSTLGIGPKQQQDLNFVPMWLASSESENDFYFSSDDEDNSDDEDAVSSRSEKSGTKKKPKTYNQFLPKHISEVCSKQIDSYLAEMSQPFEDGLFAATSPELRQSATMSCKVLVACHLFGLNHPFINYTVVRLAEECPQIDIDDQASPVRKSSQFLYLLRLAKLGLNVQRIIQDAVVDAEKSEVNKGKEVPETYAFAPLDL